MPSAFTHMTFMEVLEDLQSRFIINVPLDELASIERICFQIEQAHWFYEDFVRECQPSLQSLSLKNFSAHFFRTCPLLVNWASDHEQAFSTFMEYKVRVPVCGAIILNEKLDKVLLVRGWKSNSGWGFPKGKINKGESEAACAVREVLEETGYDIQSRLQPNEHVERTMKEQRIRLYIIRGVAENTEFLTQTRKEIGDIRWFPLKSLPGYKDETEIQGSGSKYKFYMVTVFVSSLKKWISAQSNANPQSMLTAYGGGNAPYESKNNGGASVTNVGNNQDSEDWGVNTLNQATNLIKSLIGLGSSQNEQLSNQVNTNNKMQFQFISDHKPISIPPTFSMQQHSQSLNGVGIDREIPGQHSLQFQQTSPHGYSSSQGTFFGSSMPLQGIITASDRSNTHATIQLFSSNNSIFSPTTPQNVNNSLQNDSKTRKFSLKDMPPPPIVKPQVAVLNEEIKASYGGGGGGPKIPMSMAPVAGQSLLDILRMGPSNNSGVADGEVAEGRGVIDASGSGGGGGGLGAGFLSSSVIKETASSQATDVNSLRSILGIPPSPKK